jgi:APA family basic amino acid/polyamine antiporter
MRADMSRLLGKKDLAAVIREASDPNIAEGTHGLRRSLGAFHLTMLGIGAIIGAGIFSLTGAAAANYAGPGIAYSFVIGGVLCAFAGLCYAELAAMIPVAGSAYAYAYTTMGEFVAWIIGWDLILEYAFGAVVVSIAWSGYFVQLLGSLDITLADSLLVFTKGPFETVTLADQSVVHGIWNVPATIVGLGCAAVLYRGITESAWVNNLIVVVKVTIVCVFIILGIGLVSGENLFVNEHATGLASLVPEPIVTPEGDVRYGWLGGGVLTGAGVVFFAYIGFDAVSTTAQEARNPQRDLPIGILASLVICTVLYILVAVTLTGVVHYSQLAVPAPIAVGIDRIVELRGWSDGARHAFTATIKLGALAGLTSVILVMMLGQTRIFYAMSGDGLLPWFHRTHAKHKTPYVATLVTGSFVAIAGGLFPMSVVGELVSIGTLLAFVLVCLGVPLLRRSNPGQPRPFKVPAPWVIGILGAVACVWVMIGLPVDTWGRLVVWLEIGLAVYFTYGRYWSVVRSKAGTLDTPPSLSPGAAIGAIVAGLAMWTSLLWIWPWFWHLGQGFHPPAHASGFAMLWGTVIELIIQFAIPGAIAALGFSAVLIGAQARGGARPDGPSPTTA